MWLGLAVLFIGSFSMITAHPTKALSSEISRRDEQASIFGQVNVLSPRESSSLNGGATASNYLPADNALGATASNDLPGNNLLASSGTGASPVDQPLGNMFQIGARPTLPVDQPLGENLGLHVGVGLNKQSGDDTTLQNEDNASDEQISDGPFRGNQGAAADDAVYTPLELCDPSNQKNVKLRPRVPWCTPIIRDQPNIPNANPNTNDIPKVETSPKPLKAPSAIEDTKDLECIIYTSGVLPLGVCSSSNPNNVHSSALNYGSFDTVRLSDADIGK